MLLSRPQPNIEAKDLAWIDESNDFTDLNGYFKDPHVKQLIVSYLICKIVIFCVGHHAQAFLRLPEEKGSKSQGHREVFYLGHDKLRMSRL